MIKLTKNVKGAGIWKKKWRIYMNGFIGTALVGTILLIIVALIIAFLVKEKKNGKSSCSGECSNCGRKCP